jgi:hypothetical protein
MKYVEVDGVGSVRRIGLRTWQFGSAEWGLRLDFFTERVREKLGR